MKLRTRVFNIYKEKHKSLPKLAKAMGISVSQIYRVREGEHSVNQKLIIGTIKAFPEYDLGDLFYLGLGLSENERGQHE